MRFFMAEDTLSFHYGAILGLNENQSASRLANGSIRALKDGKFEVLKETQLKRGEVFGIEGEIPKAYIPKLAETAKQQEAVPASKVPDQQPGPISEDKKKEKKEKKEKKKK